MPGKIVRVFIDSNVLISGLFSDKGAPRLILDILGLDLPRLKAVTSAFNIAETERTLEKKLPAALPAFRSCLSRLGPDIVPLPSRKDIERLAGVTAEKDLPVVASAIQGRADVLVTGDQKHLLKIRRGALPFLVLSPGEFLEKFLPTLLKET
jgi:predicted nucleic acid-binding protein